MVLRAIIPPDSALFTMATIGVGRRIRLRQTYMLSKLQIRMMRMPFGLGSKEIGSF